jgi:hypothetical protein
MHDTSETDVPIVRKDRERGKEIYSVGPVRRNFSVVSDKAK